MNFTFGIITDGNNEGFIKKTIESIKKQQIPNFEIIVIGGKKEYENCIHIPFDETIKTAWITRKKNIICEIALYENIVLMHDYIELCDDWYQGFLLFGNDFDICVTKIKNHNGVRFRDYSIFPYGISDCLSIRALIPYHYAPSIKLSKLMYISGAYYIIKKYIASKFPLDERLRWGDGEDVELSKRLIANNIILKCNNLSTVIFQKQKLSCNWEIEMNHEDLIYFENLSSEQIENMHLSQVQNLKNYVQNSCSVIL